MSSATTILVSLQGPIAFLVKYFMYGVLGYRTELATLLFLIFDVTSIPPM